MGVLDIDGASLPLGLRLEPALRALDHRGPDGRGVQAFPSALLGACRLALRDPLRGAQPMRSPCGRFGLVFNGELYECEEHRRRLASHGHRFRTTGDTEVLLHLLMSEGEACLERIDGQFALGFFDTRERTLLLARDRMGISPLFHTRSGSLLAFASEAKGLFALGLVEPEIDPRGLDAITAFGAVPAPHSVFRDVQVLPPGTTMTVGQGRCVRRTYWDLDYPQAGDYGSRPVAAWAGELRERLRVAVQRRLTADAPVGVYLSGGIDSAAVAALAREVRGAPLPTFSVRFPEPGFDEGSGIQDTARRLSLAPEELLYTQERLAEDVHRFLYFAETPMISTESLPLFALSELAGTRAKAVLTGEGSDEALGGYLYFVWEKLRLMLERAPLGRLPLGVLRMLGKRILGEPNGFFPGPDELRWADEVFGFLPASGIFCFYWRQLREMVYSAPMKARLQGLSDAEFLHLPRDRMRRWDPLNRSLYVSSRLFMSNHLLAAHGDRALMAHSVEGRYPFLDRDVQDLMARVPPHLKIRNLQEKYLLRRAMAKDLPRGVLERAKKPFLAPFGTPFVGPGVPESVVDLLSPERLEEFGFFDPARVAGIIAKLEPYKLALAGDQKESIRIDRTSMERTLAGMALTFVVTTQALEATIRSGAFAAVEDQAPAARESAA